MACVVHLYIYICMYVHNSNLVILHVHQLLSWHNLHDSRFDYSLFVNAAVMSPVVDIYSFGMCALEMAALEIQGNGESSAFVTEDQVQRTIEGLEVAVQNDFIRACLKKDPALRPTARGLLFHGALFEVSSLKLIAAHTVVRCSGKRERETTPFLLRMKS